MISWTDPSSTAGQIQLNQNINSVLVCIQKINILVAWSGNEYLYQAPTFALKEMATSKEIQHFMNMCTGKELHNYVYFWAPYISTIS